MGLVTSAADAGVLFRCQATAPDAKQPTAEGRVMLCYSAALASTVANSLEPQGEGGDACKGFRVTDIEGSGTWFVILTNRYLKLMTPGKKNEVKKRWHGDFRIDVSAAPGSDCNLDIEIFVDPDMVRKFRCKTRDEREQLVACFRCFQALGARDLCSELFMEEAFNLWKNGQAGEGVAARLRLPTEDHSIWVKASVVAVVTGADTPGPGPEVPFLVEDWISNGWLEARTAMASLCARLEADEVYHET